MKGLVRRVDSVGPEKARRQHFPAIEGHSKSKQPGESFLLKNLRHEEFFKRDGFFMVDTDSHG
jgi:hypothetical protein